MIRYLFLFVSCAIEMFALSRWFGCWLFKEDFYLSLESVSAKVIQTVNEDYLFPHFFVRLIHNKVLTGGWYLVQTMLSYWDSRFLMELIGLVGVFGVYFALWRLVTAKKKSYTVRFFFVLLVVFSFVEMIFRPHVVFAWRFMLLGFAFQMLSLIGIHQYLEKRSLRRYWVIAGICILSFFLLLFYPLFYQEFCLKI